MDGLIFYYFFSIMLDGDFFDESYLGLVSVKSAIVLPQ